MKNNFKFIFNFIKNYLTFRTRKFASIFQLQKWQLKKLKKHAKSTLLKSPYYKTYAKKLLSENPKDLLEALKIFPILEKKEFLAEFNKINTCGINFDNAMQLALKSEKDRSFSARIGSIDIGLSTGTSGQRGLFLVSPEERALWAGLVLARTLHAGLYKKQKIALVLRSNNNLYESVGSKKINFQYFDLLNPVDNIYNDIKLYDPTIIVGPPSCLEFFARKDLQLDYPYRLQPTQVICGAETLTDEIAKTLQRAWNVPCAQIYQATEGSIAYTCPAGSLHVNEDVIIMEKEYIDKKNGFFIPILTDIKRHTQPIIRHRLTDVLVEDLTPCACGSHFLKLSRIEGRLDDVLFFDNKPIFPDFLTRAILRAHSDIEDFRIVQPDENTIQVGLKLKDENFREQINHIVKQELELCAHQLQAKLPHFQVQTFMPEINGHKRRRVKRQFIVANINVNTTMSAGL